MTTTNLTGQIFLDQFRVDAFVAAGGMGVVYRVWDMHRNVPLAMKVLHADLAEDPSIYKRFQREARALEQLTHPHIIPFYGLYRTPGFSFILEAYVDGDSLKNILRQRGVPLPPQEALIYLRALSSALNYAHNFGVVHCDVKPGNVLVNRGGDIYLTDFGIARHAESTQTTLGHAGSPAYMAPEQIRGEPVSGATDVYALGLVLYEMLTARRPFTGLESESESLGATAAERIRLAHLSVPAPDPRQFNPALPAGLAPVLAKSLEKEPKRRQQSTLDLYAETCATLGMPAESIPARVAPLSLPPTTMQVPAPTYIPPATFAQAAIAPATIAPTDAPLSAVPGLGAQTIARRVPWVWAGLAGLLLVVIAFLMFTLLGGDGTKMAQMPSETNAPAALVIQGTDTEIAPGETLVVEAPTLTLEPSATPTEIPPTDTLIPTEMPTETPTPVPAEILLLEWSNENFDLTDSGCPIPGAQCWLGLRGDKILLFKQTIYIDPAWSNPVLLFRHRYDIPESIAATVSVQVEGSQDWTLLRSFGEGEKGWYEEQLSLAEYAGKSVLFRFYVPWGSTTVRRTGADGTLSDVYYYSDWMIQHIRLVPNYIQ